MKTETTTHTPGPWEVDAEFTGVKTVSGHIGMDASQLRPARMLGQGVNMKANARLIAAACTSYDKHCGANAVECAEADLLGELLRVCEAARKFAINAITANVDLPNFDPTQHVLVKRIDAAIDKATSTGDSNDDD